MPRMLFSFCLILLSLSPRALAEAPMGQDLSVSAREGLRLGEVSLLILVRAEVGSFDEVRVHLPRRSGQNVKPGQIPAEWTMGRDGNELVFRGPATQGPSFLRLDLLGSRPPLRVAIRVFVGNRLLTGERRILTDLLPRLRVERSLAGILHLPPLVTPGELIQVTLLDEQFSPPAGRWFLFGVPMQAAPGSDAALLRVVAPALWRPWASIRAVYVNHWGEWLVDAEAAEVRVIPTGLGVPLRPRLGPCAVSRTEGEIACACGWFPPGVVPKGITIDGAAPTSPPVAVAERSLCFRLPVGTHRIAGLSEFGFGAENSFEAGLVKVLPPNSAKLRRGATETRTWEVVGTHEPVRLRLWNRSPRTIRLEGGDLQAVMTSGGPKNTVTRRVTGLTAGNGRITIDLSQNTSPLLNPEYETLLAAAVERDLRQVEHKFTEAVQHLAAKGSRPGMPPGVYRMEDVRELILYARARIDDALAYPDLSPLRDSIDSIFAGLALEFEDVITVTSSERSTAALGLIQPGTAVFQASLQTGSATDGFMSDLDAQRFFGIIEKLIADLLRTLEPRGGRRSLIRDLCIVTEPDGAEFKIYPLSFPSDSQITATNASLRVVLGRLRYEIRKPGYKSMAFEVDLLLQAVRRLECGLVAARQRGETLPCRLLADADPRCPSLE